MMNVPEGYIPGPRPSPLAGLGEAAKTLADAVIQGRERTALLTDYDLLGTVLARMNQPVEATEPPPEGEQPGVPWPTVPADTGAMLQDTLAKMTTLQGKTAAIKMMIDHAPKSLYGYDETGNLVQKGTMPKNAEILKADPMTLEDKKQAGLALRDDKKQEHAINLEIMREKTREAGDWRKYGMIMDAIEKKGDLQEKLKNAGSVKDRTELARKELINANQKAKENYNRQMGNIRKQHTDPLTGTVDEEKLSNASAQAQREYQQDLELIQSAYADVIRQYDIRLPGMGGEKGPAGKAEVLPGGTRDAVKSQYQGLLKANPEAAKAIAVKYPWLAQ